MKREQRLRKGTEFDEAYSQGTAIGGPLVVLRVRPNDLGYTRWGFAVGKKIAPLATKRNQVRRRLREIARSLDWHESQDIVVTARKDALPASSSELRAAIERGLKKSMRLSA